MAVMPVEPVDLAKHFAHVRELVREEGSAEIIEALWDAIEAAEAELGQGGADA